MAHALWRGAISFGLVSIPVALYPATSASGNVTFHMLHKDDLTRIHNRLIDEQGHEVRYEDVVKGYEYEKGRYVVVDGEDLKRANVEATQTIDIMHFVDRDAIDVAYFDTPSFTEPTKAGRKAYALLRETLHRTGKAGVAKLVIRERQHLCAVMAEGLVLVAYTLRWPYQLRTALDLDLPGEDLEALNVTSQELSMAEQLVMAMHADWEPQHYTDTYRDDLLRLIGEKVKGGVVTGGEAPPPDERGAEVVDIMALLKRSVEQRGVAETRTSGGTTGRRRAGGTPGGAH